MGAIYLFKQKSSFIRDKCFPLKIYWIYEYRSAINEDQLVVLIKIIIN